MSIHGHGAMAIARLGGLPCDVMDAFSTRLGDSLESRRHLEKALRQARAELVDRLYEVIPGAAEDWRPRLLAARRDSYNGRPLDGSLRTVSWQDVDRAAEALVQRVLELERQLDSSVRDFAVAYEEETRRQHRHLAGLLDETAFRCGLVVASPLVARQAQRLRNKAPDRYGRRERRLASTLLRYASRAALKLSPFSTFTSVGLARIEETAEPLALVGGGWHRRSLVRLRRHLLDRCAHLLRRYPPWRQRLLLVLNDSATALDDGRILYHRPGHYEPDGEAMKLRFHEESLARAGLHGPLVERLKSLLATAPMPLAGVVPLLAAELGDEASEAAVAEQLDRLIDIGYLQLLAPWSADDGHLERTMLRELRLLSGDPSLAAFCALLGELVELEDALFESSDPAATFGAIERLIDPLLRSAAALAGLKSEMDVTTRSSEHDVYQDVWCSPPDDRNGAVVRLGRRWAATGLRSIQPLVRYARLFDHKLELLSSLGAFLRQNRGDRCRVPLLEGFQRVQPLWQEFMKFQVASHEGGNEWRKTWNPLALAPLADLAHWREAARQSLSDCLIDGPDGRRMSIEALEALLARVPRCYTDNYGGACLFLQPASADGSLWVLNRVKEGTGRFASRYTALMAPALQQCYGRELSSRGTLEIDGETVELLDVQSIQGDTLNVHAPQTPRVLVFPGLHSDLPAERRRHLGDLVIALDGDGWPQLRDRDGRRYLPVHLGVGYMDYMPTLVKFLCAFGPSEMGAVFPPPLVREVNGATVQERTVIGNLLLHRRSWSFPVEDLRRRCDLQAEAEVFAVLHRLRAEYGIPGQVFALERVPHPIRGSRYRPQYLDLTSPLFVAIWRSILEAADAYLTLVEALPSADLFPCDAQGRRWAVEVLVDSLSLRPAGDRGLADRRVESVDRAVGPAVLAGVRPAGDAGDGATEFSRQPRARRALH